MNYFELFGLEEDFNIDLKKLKQTYLKLSKKYHPDFSTLESEEIQDANLKMSAKINEAYKVLADEDSRIQYILSLNGLIDETENKKMLAPSFLYEIMELNEELLEIDSSENTSDIKIFEEKLNNYFDRIKIDSGLFTTNSVPFLKSNKLDQLLLYYLKKKYIQRLYEQLKI